MLSAPFFAVYMLEDLGFSYVTFTIVSMSSMIFYLLFVPLAGKFSDKYGNLKLFYIAGFLFPVVPLLWIFLKNPVFLVLFPGIISGIANSAFILSVTNFTYDSVSPQRRGLCVAYSSLLTGIGVFLGSVIGGLLIQYSNVTFMKPIFFVFLLSSFLIFISSLIFLPHIKEMKEKDKMNGFSVDVQHPFKSVHSDVVWFKNFFKS
jgi:MFS family permease